MDVSAQSTQTQLNARTIADIIRNSLSAICGGKELLASNDSSQDKQMYLSFIESGCARLEQLANDLNQNKVELNRV